MAKAGDLRVYFNSNGIPRTYPVNSLEEGAWLFDKLAQGDLDAGEDIDFNVMDVEVFDGESLDWETYYDEDGEPFSEVYDRQYHGKKATVKVTFE